MTDHKTSSSVAHEAEDVRANLAHTLEQLRENLKPENVVEEVVNNARVGANSIADGLYALARENPLPAMLIGAGCALVFGLTSRTGLRRPSVLDLRASAGDAIARHDRTGLGAIPHLAQSFGASAASASPRKSWVPYRKTGDFIDTPTFESSSETVEIAMNRSTDSFRPTGMPSGSRLKGILHDQPLIIAALGVAVGAAIGAALPKTAVEDEWMGDTSASVKHAARDAARNELDELKAVASRTADNFKRTAADHGLSGDNLSDLVRDAGEHAKTAIHDVGAGTQDHLVS